MKVSFLFLTPNHASLFSSHPLVIVRKCTTKSKQLRAQQYRSVLYTRKRGRRSQPTAQKVVTFKEIGAQKPKFASLESGFTDATETNLHDFILETLHKNERDRRHVLAIEQTLLRLLDDKTRDAVTFSPMTSYERMIVHRVSAYFGLAHDVAQSGLQVVVSKRETARV